MNTTTNTAPKISLDVCKFDWKLAYNDESDTLYWTIIPPPKHLDLVSVSPEISFYTDPAGEVRGLMIEWFKSSFLAHHPKATPLSHFLNDLKEGYWTIAKKDEHKASEMLAALYEAVQENVRSSYSATGTT